jgi:hypothetical protein
MGRKGLTISDPHRNPANVGPREKNMQNRLVGFVAAFGVSLSAIPIDANGTCNTITTSASVLTLVAVDCAEANVWTTLKASGQFPDVFFSNGKTTDFCYKLSQPATASIGQHNVTISAGLSTFTTDFFPKIFGGTDDLATVVTQLTFNDPSGNYTGKLFTRDTIDTTRVAIDGSATEEDVIVGGTNNFGGAKGTYRLNSSANADASVVMLTSLNGIVCTSN